MNTALAIFAIVAALGLATATATLVVIPNIPQAQAFGRFDHPSGSDHPSGCSNPGGQESRNPTC